MKFLLGTGPLRLRPAGGPKSMDLLFVIIDIINNIICIIIIIKHHRGLNKSMLPCAPQATLSYSKLLGATRGYSAATAAPSTPQATLGYSKFFLE